MGKRNKRNSQIKSKPDFLSSLAGLSLEELDSIQKAAPMAFQSKLQSVLSSNDTEELLKANLYLGEINKTNPHIQSVFFDPNDLAGNGKGFKDSKGVLSFSTLRRMGDIYIIRAIVNTRIEQVQNFLHFSEDEQKEGYTIRRKKSLFKEEKEDELSNEDKRKIENIVKFLENGGWNEKWDNLDSFQEFVRKITFDSLTLDQLAFEVVRSRDWELKKFRAIDASLIRFLDTVDPRQREAFEGYRFKGYLPRYCMVWDDMIIRNPMTKEPILYYPWELGFGIRNKTSNIRKNGYGTSELETLVEIITWILWGMSYNGLFFKQGSQPKGFINVKNANISPSTLNEFRQAWMQTMRGVENCLSEESFIITKDGGFSIKDVLKGKDEKEIEIWTGKEFQRACVYKTSEKKQLTKMKLNNGMDINCSPNHKFKVISDDGIIKWKERKDIKLGDFVLVNNKIIDVNKQKFIYKGKEVDADLFEFLGWATGDGWFGENLPRKKRMSTFYHSIKERDIQERHSQILNKYGINNKPKEIFYSKKQQEDIIEKFGFNSVAKSRLETCIIDSDFIEWIFDLGFESSKNGKVIPAFLYSVRTDYRRAFLRGFFSADGSVVNKRYIQMFITSDSLREATKQLLLTEGICCGVHEQNNYKDHFTHKVKPRMILIKDNKLFFERIGFLQQHKQPIAGELDRKRKKTIHQSMVINTLKSLQKWIKENKIKYIDKNDSSVFANAYSGKDSMSKERLITFINKYNYPLGDDIKDYSFEEVIELKESEEKVQMYDVEVYDNEHQFVVNGMISHNSHRVPVINGIDLEWIDLQKGNRDMEFNDWLKFLVIMSCSVYRIDPTELGFQFKDQAQIFGQDGQKARLQHSREKGLKPILVFLENVITKYIVSELDEDFEFSFTGIEVEDEEAQVKLDAEKLEKGMVAMQDIFQKYSGRPLDPENDIIINQVYQTAKQAEQQQQMYGASVPGESEEAGVPNDEESFSENPFDKYKSFDNNPILAEAINYYKTNLYK